MAAAGAAAAAVLRTGNVNRDRKPALPSAQPFQYTPDYGGTPSEIRAICGLGVFVLSKLDEAFYCSALRSEKGPTVVPHEKLRSRSMFQAMLLASRSSGVQCRLDLEDGATNETKRAN